LNLERFSQIYGQVSYVQHEIENLKWLVDKVEELCPHVIIEIGVREGGTLKFWEQLIGQTCDDLLIGVDIHPKIRWGWESSPKSIKIVQGNSLELDTIGKVATLLGSRLADFLYLDADDSNILHDFTNYSPFVREGGIVGVHDFNLGTQKHFPETPPYISNLYSLLKGRKEYDDRDKGVVIWYKGGLG